MKLNTTITALFIGFLPVLTAQDTPAEKPAAEEAAKEVKPEGPLEERAFRIFDLVGQFPDVIASIKDEKTLAAAETKLDAVSKKLEAEAEELEKLPVAPNEARKKLSAKMELKEKGMQKKMQGIMASMSQMDPALAQGTFAMMTKFGGKMEKIGPLIEKSFSPDEEKEDADE